MDLKLWFQPCLFAKCIGSNTIKTSMSFNWYNFIPIGINRVITTLSQQIKAMGFKKSDQITPFDRHHQPLPAFALSNNWHEVFPFLFPYMPRPSQKGHLRALNDSLHVMYYCLAICFFYILNQALLPFSSTFYLLSIVVFAIAWQMLTNKYQQNQFLSRSIDSVQ